MYDLFIQTTLMLSLGAIIYLVASALPRISEVEDVNGGSLRDKAKSLGSILPLDQVDSKLNAIKNKTLRRLKVWVMKADNFLSKRLNNGGDKI